MSNMASDLLKTLYSFMHSKELSEKTDVFVDNDISDEMFLREFKTVGFKLPRQLGCTTAISEFIKDKNAAVIVNSKEHKVFYLNNSIPEDKIYTLSEFHNTSYRLFDCIVVDDLRGTYLQNAFYKHVAALCGRNPTIFIIG